jgi:hypothetical protein
MTNRKLRQASIEVAAVPEITVAKNEDASGAKN